MSGYLEAKKDGIEIKRFGSSLEYVKFYVTCSECGNKMLTNNYSRNKNYQCKECHEKEKKTYKRVRADRMYTGAKKNILNMIEFDIDIKKVYKESFEKVRQDVLTGTRFDSKEEIMVAIELTRASIPYELHKKMCGYELDFYLPDEKINLEVDGVIYHNNKVKQDLQRDIELKNYNGEDFKTVRILDTSINYSVYNIMDKVHKALQNQQYYMIGNYITDNNYCLLSY